MEKIGEVLREIRKRKKLTQKMLADGVCSQSVLSRIESNEEIPNVAVMYQLCRRLGVGMEEIFVHNHENLQRNHRWLSDMDHLMMNNDYEKLKSYLENEEILQNLYLDSDLQKYYYYLGSVTYYVDRQVEEAYSTLLLSLQYTYTPNKQIVTATEIQIMSCIGKVLAEWGRVREGMEYLDKALRLFHETPKDRLDFGLAKIFYNHGSVYFEAGDLLAAEESVNGGIRWAIHCHSNYYLQELFSIKAAILKKSHRLEEAKKYVDLSENMRKIRKDMFFAKGLGS